MIMPIDASYVKFINMFMRKVEHNLLDIFKKNIMFGHMQTSSYT